MAEDGDTPFRFSDLPPELRNRIYKHALVDEEPVCITTSGYDRPPLVSTCRQIRKEAIEIYYAGNVFVLVMPSYDSTPVALFDATLPALSCYVDVVKDWRYYQVPNWPNLLRWLQLNHKQDDNWPLLSKYPVKLVSRDRYAKRDYLVVSGMFAMVRELSCVPWERLQAVLEAQRPILVRIDRRWGLDE